MLGSISSSCTRALELPPAYGDTIDLKAATQKKIKVSCVPDYCRDEVADHTVALSLVLCRKINIYNDLIRSGKWSPFGAGPIPRLSETTYGILGFGNIAQRVAKRMQAFNCHIIAYDPYLPDSVFDSTHVQRAASIEEVFMKGGFVSLNLPLTDETFHIVNKKTLNLMKKRAYLINTVRGALVNQDDLYTALKEERIAGAGLDVFEEEPLSASHPLCTLNNVLLSPHAAFFSVSSLPDLDKKTMEEVIRALTGQPLNTWGNKF